MRRSIAFLLAFVLVFAPALTPGLAQAIGDQEDDLSSVSVDTDNEGQLAEDPTPGPASDEDESDVVSKDDEDATEGDKTQSLDSDDDLDHADAESMLTDDEADDNKALDPLAEEMAEESVRAEEVEDESAMTAEQATPSVEYVAHVQNEGWQKTVSNGAVAGTSGKGLRVEALRIWLRGIDAAEGGLEYRMHVQNEGWLGWVRDGELGGTESRALRVEAFQLQLYGKAAQSYDVWYRVHAQNIGWMAWAKNGQLCGSEGKALRLEAMQIRVVPRGTTPQNLEESDVSYSFASATESSKASGDLSITTHVQNKGWKTAVGGGATAGSSGEGLRLEAFRIDTADRVLADGLIYHAHVQNEGWQEWQTTGGIAGTTGRGLRIEAIEIALEGAAEEAYDVYYRSHVQNIGWMAWASNGEASGSMGLSFRCEAIQVRIVPKGQSIQLPASGYRGAFVNAAAELPPNTSVKLVPELQHGNKPFGYQRCIVMHDTTEYQSFDYWIGAWIGRGGSGTHFMVKEDGSIRQYADLNQICWHASGATRPSIDTKYNVVAYKAGAGSAMNQCSIGIEIDHVGDGRDYPEAQLDALDALVAYIDEYYGFQSTILQHKDYHLINEDCSPEFQKYLRHLQQTRTTR